jgi:signal transduction histidine kinase
MDERVGATLRGDKGFTPSNRLALSATLSRALAFGLPAAAVFAGVIGVLVALAEPALTGVALEPQGVHVQSVDPGSLAWSAGIRPGQTVVSMGASGDPNGWWLITFDGIDEHALRQGAATATARLGIAPATIAVVLGLSGLVAARRHRRRAELLGSLGLFVAWIPLAASHEPTAGPIVGAICAVAGAVWLVRWLDQRRVAGALLTFTVVLDGAAIASRALGDNSAATFESWRFDWAATIATGLVAIALGVTPKAVARRSASLRFVDIAAAVTGLLVISLVQLVAAPPPWLPVLLVASGLVIYRPIRATARTWMDRAIFAEERERAGIESAETERARLSRELHDDPLQSLVGVILRLEERKENAREQETLRAVAGQLRKIAVSLHPPVLDDLGLVPAVESLFAEEGPIPVELELRSTPGFRPADRPPFEVELATYRIIQEAATNAIRHSGCRHILVRGDISPGAVSIDVVDDGRGIRERDIEDALRRGHLGVASMRRRAEAIDARLTHEPASGSGTIVTLRWSA